MSDNQAVPCKEDAELLTIWNKVLEASNAGTVPVALPLVRPVPKSNRKEQPSRVLRKRSLRELIEVRKRHAKEDLLLKDQQKNEPQYDSSPEEDNGTDNCVYNHNGVTIEDVSERCNDEDDDNYNMGELLTVNNLPLYTDECLPPAKRKCTRADEGVSESVLYQEHMKSISRHANVQEHLSQIKQRFHAAPAGPVPDKPDGSSRTNENHEHWTHLRRKFNITQSEGKYPHLIPPDYRPTQEEHERSLALVRSARELSTKVRGRNTGLPGQHGRMTPLCEITPTYTQVHQLIENTLSRSQSGDPNSQLSYYERTKTVFVNTIAPNADAMASLVYCMMMSGHLRPSVYHTVTVMETGRSDGAQIVVRRPIPYFRWRIEHEALSSSLRKEPLGIPINPSTGMRIEIDRLVRSFMKLVLLREPRAPGEPPCVKAKKCQGMQIFVNHRRVCRAYVSPVQWLEGQFTAGKGNKCLMCMLDDVGEDYGRALGGMAQLNIERELIAHFYNVVDSEGEYDMRDCLWNLPKRYLGLYGPIVCHTLFSYVSRPGTLVVNNRTYDNVVFFDQYLACPGFSLPDDPNIQADLAEEYPEVFRTGLSEHH